MIDNPNTEYDVVVHIVSHDKFKDLDFDVIKSDNGVVYDVKGSLDKNLADRRL